MNPELPPPRRRQLGPQAAVFRDSPSFGFEGSTLRISTPPSGKVRDRTALDLTAIDLTGVERAAASVGRIELEDSFSRRVLGTAWVIGPGLIATNRHLVGSLAEPGRVHGEAGFAETADIVTLTFVLDVQPGLQRRPFAIAGLVWLAAPGEADVALLRLVPSPGQELPPALALEDFEAEQTVALIGHPIQQEGAENRELLEGLPPDGRKRVAFGPVMELEGADLIHRATAFGGSSGSPLVNPRTGRVVGMHFDGRRTSLVEARNLAVPSGVLAGILRRLVG